MSKRYLLAAAALASLVPTLAIAQARPATPAPRPATPPPQQPAARPATMMSGTAQRQGAIELGIQATAFMTRGQVTTAINNYGIVAAGDAPGQIIPGVMARFGYHVTPKIAVGANLGYGMSSGLTLMQYQANAAYTMNPDAQMSPLVSAYVGGSSFAGDGANSPLSGFGGGVGVGLRRFMGEKLAVRVDVRGIFESFGAVGTNASFTGLTPSAGAGVSYYMGGGPPRDTDMDGVPDRRDACANTTRGATVDARGCPQDTDRDGVYNGLDRCPDTPASTPVDANGCTRDTDRDGIADNADRCANTPAGTQVDATGCPRDTDGDTVADAADRCANTPRGTPVDANGCPRDTDGDTVIDPSDRCPSTPAGTPVDANGCPRDTDGDGVSDNNDRCQNTAAGTQVDAAGCPVQRDADRDGVVDANDRCPNTATTARVDATGCPLYDLPAANATKVVALTFAGTTTRPTLTPAARTVLDQVATAIQATPGSRWEVGAYTDNRGTAAVLNRTSQARAQAVVDYLVSKGVAASQLTAVGYGSRNPIQPNTTVAGRSANRRVEIKRLQ